MKQTYRGSCHCGAVAFEADIDFAEATTGKCNCTFCWKKRAWNVKVRPDAFRELAGADLLRRYPTGPHVDGGGFCPTCGAAPYLKIAAAEWNDGPEVSVNVACLDDLDPAELLAARVQYFDGRADNWWSPPAETRHL